MALLVSRREIVKFVRRVVKVGRGATNMVPFRTAEREQEPERGEKKLSKLYALLLMVGRWTPPALEVSLPDAATGMLLQLWPRQGGVLPRHAVLSGGVRPCEAGQGGERGGHEFYVRCEG